MNKKISFPISIITIIILFGIIIGTIYLLDYLDKGNVNLETFIKQNLNDQNEIIEELKEKESLIIAIASLQDNDKGEVSRQAGRAPFYLLFNEKGDFLELIFNESVTAEDGAGPSTAIMLSGKGVDIVIAGVIGKNMAEELNNQGIKYYEKQGLIVEVLNNILEKYEYE